MDSTWAVGLLAAALCMGLLSAALARFSAGSRGQTFFRCWFILWFALSGIGTMGASAFGPGFALSGGTALAVMLLAATWGIRVGSAA